MDPHPGVGRAFGEPRDIGQAAGRRQRSGPRHGVVRLGAAERPEHALQFEQRLPAGGLDAGQRLPRLLGLGVHDPRRRSRQHRDDPDAVRDAVVQFAGDPQPLGHDGAGRPLLMQGSEVFTAFAIHPPEDPRDREPQRELPGPLGRVADGLPGVDVDVLDERGRDGRDGADGGSLRPPDGEVPAQEDEQDEHDQGPHAEEVAEDRFAQDRHEDRRRQTAHQQNRKGEHDAQTHHLEGPEAGKPKQAGTTTDRPTEHQRVEAGGGQYHGPVRQPGHALRCRETLEKLFHTEIVFSGVGSARRPGDVRGIHPRADGLGNGDIHRPTRRRSCGT